MKIRKTKTVLANVSFEEACIYALSDTDGDSDIHEMAKYVAADNGYIKESVTKVEASDYYAEFNVVTDCEMTPDEEIAYTCIKLNNLINSSKVCDMVYVYITPSCNIGLKDMLFYEKILEGRDVIK